MLQRWVSEREFYIGVYTLLCQFMQPVTFAHCAFIYLNADYHIGRIFRYPYRGGSRIECRGVLSIPRALARAKLCATPTLTSFPHTTCYTKKK